MYFFKCGLKNYLTLLSSDVLSVVTPALSQHCKLPPYVLTPTVPKMGTPNFNKVKLFRSLVKLKNSRFQILILLPKKFALFNDPQGSQGVTFGNRHFTPLSPGHENTQRAYPLVQSVCSINSFASICSQFPTTLQTRVTQIRPTQISCDSRKISLNFRASNLFASKNFSGRIRFSSVFMKSLAVWYEQCCDYFVKTYRLISINLDVFLHFTIEMFLLKFYQKLL